MTRLEDTQRLLWQLITAREGLPNALVCGDERFGAADRVEVYASMYFFRLLECLAEDFPALHAIVGHETFHALAADYLDAHPSEHPSVRMLGRRLGDFVDRHPLGAERFWLGDLVRFEWSLLDAFDAVDAESLGADRLAEVEAERWAELRFTLTPSLRVLETAAPVDDVWKAATEGKTIPSIVRASTAVRIWRQDLDVFHRRLEPVELVALRAAARGERFDQICEAAASLAGEEGAVAEVIAVLRRWLGDRMIVGLSYGGSAE